MHAAVIDDRFRARRAQNWVFLGLMYAMFYMARYNLSVADPYLLKAFGWTKIDLGILKSAGLITYGISVFLNGPLADRIGGKRAILIGAGGSAVCNCVFAFFGAHLAAVGGGRSAAVALAFVSAANFYFQSFGALSIVKINAAWFHVRERGSFAGIFGVMIQSGRTFAFFFSPFILRYLPWQYCFWIPSGILAVMFFMNRRFVEDSPQKAGYDFYTADETKEEAEQKPTLGFVLKKVFASPSAWLIAFSSMCIGMVRNSVDHWWARYIGTVFNVKAADLS